MGKSFKESLYQKFLCYDFESKEMNDLMVCLSETVALDQIPDINSGFSQCQSLLHYLANFCPLDYSLLFHNKGVTINCNIFDAYNNTPLQIALISNNTRAARVLMTHGADVNLSVGTLHPPLHLFCMVIPKEPEIFDLMLSLGADVNRKDGNGNTALHLVDDISLAILLIKNGADYKAKNNNGKTPIDTIGVEQQVQQVVQYIEEINCR